MHIVFVAFSFIALHGFRCILAVNQQLYGVTRSIVVVHSIHVYTVLHRETTILKDTFLRHMPQMPVSRRAWNGLTLKDAFLRHTSHLPSCLVQGKSVMDTWPLTSEN